MTRDKRTKAQLLSECERLGLSKYKSKTKGELIKLIDARSRDVTAVERPATSTPSAQIVQDSDDNCHIVCGDCMSEMKKLQDKSIDMILCDLPYGMTKNHWDVVIPFDSLWTEYSRVIKDSGAIVLFGSQPFTSLMITSNMKMFRYCLVWEKNKFSDFLNSKRKPMKTNEDIAVFYKKQPTYNPQYWFSTPYTRWNTQSAVDKQSNYGAHKENFVESTDGRRLPTTVLKFNRVERPAHPTEKPVDMLEWLLRTYTNEGELVLDNCMGAGSTGVACKNTKRKFMGMELDQTYYNIAKGRLFNSPDPGSSSERSAPVSLG